MEGFLFDVKVLELAEEQGEFCGKLFAGAGADVVKIEPRHGQSTREIGPFYKDEKDLERSLYFWHYNFGKRGVTLDTEKEAGREILRRLLADTDVVIDARSNDTLDDIGLGWQELQALNPRLVYLTLPSFGSSGPWSHYKGTDLIHLALGGQMMCCGYDPDDEGHYDTPPIAPQMWHSYHIAGNQAFIAVVAALIGRESTGLGEHIEVPVHQAVSVCTEIDVPYWLYGKTPVYRQTGRHAQPAIGPPVQFATGDGRHSIVLPNPFPGGYEAVVEFLRKKGHAGNLLDEKYAKPENRRGKDFAKYFARLQAECVAEFGLEDIWHEAQDAGIPWSPIRRPEENLEDEQWRSRATFTAVQHPELETSFRYTGAPMLPETCEWRDGPRAPTLGEHNQEVFGSRMGLDDEEVQRLRIEGIV